MYISNIPYTVEQFLQSQDIVYVFETQGSRRVLQCDESKKSCISFGYHIVMVRDLNAEVSWA